MDLPVREIAEGKADARQVPAIQHSGARDQLPVCETWVQVDAPKGAAHPAPPSGLRHAQLSATTGVTD